VFLLKKGAEKGFLKRSLNRLPILYKSDTFFVWFIVIIVTFAALLSGIYRILLKSE